MYIRFSMFIIFLQDVFSFGMIYSVLNLESYVYISLSYFLIFATLFCSVQKCIEACHSSAVILLLFIC
jgi:hypothetical protein